MKKFLCIAVSLLSCGLLVTSASAFPPATWNEGDELAVFGHAFNEEYWTNESIKVNNTQGDNLTFSASYVSYENVEAFLLALNMVENENGTGSIPFQLFGMHYYTPEGREVFVAAVLAFLMVFNDTFNGTGAGANGLPDPGNEDISYVVPFGVAPLVNASYVPHTEVQPVEKLGEGHFRFGIRYLNLYAIVTPNFLASLVYRTGWLAKFSELSVAYEITVNNETGEVRAETWYTIGQVTELWAFILGVPIPLSPRDIPDTLGLSVVHFVTVFTSRYAGASGNSTGNMLNPDVNLPLGEDIVLKVGNDGERAMKIGTRGTFDLVNETSGDVVRADQDALNAIVGARLVDLWLLGWQLGFAAGCMSVFAYALSDYVQSQYSGPLDLAQRSLLPTNKQGFNANPLWYAVAFPQWDGYRVVHDPTYVAYTDIGKGSGVLDGLNIGRILVLVLMIVAVAVVIAVVAGRKKGK
ncbi:MAG: hypothetical protein ACUVT7_05415 [Thermoplasmata archaeon]